MVRRAGTMAVLVLLATVVLAACGTEQEEAEPTVTRIAGALNAPVVGETPASGGAAAGTATTNGGTGGAVAATTIDIATEDIKFDKTDLTIPADTDVTINVTNKGAAVHNFSITNTDFKTKDLASGESETLTVNLPAGEYEFDCTIPGHKEAGMVGKLIVVAGGGAPAEGGAATAAPAPATTAAPATATAAASVAATSVDVKAQDVKFDVKELTIAADTDVTITVTNEGAAVHNFSITGTDFKTKDLASGQSETITVNLPAGEYAFDCTVPGHKEAGMVGKLIVVAGGGAGTAEASPTAAATPTSGASPVPPASPSAVAVAGDVVKGQSLAAICLGCHTTNGTQSVGPTWQGLYGSTVELEDGTTVVADEAYLHESIKDPMAKIVKGFPPAMPPMGLSDADIADIIAYIESLK